MQPGGGKQKGSEFERNICKKLSMWVSHGAREDLFWRSAMSGGRATVGRKQGKDHAKHAGDISATHPLGHALTDQFYIECKFYGELKFDSWLLKSEGPLAGFWQVACEQAEAHKLSPMLIVKQNRSDPVVIVRCTNLLTPNDAGLLLNPRAFMARFMRAKADLYSFDGILQKEFKTVAVRVPFLKAGELQRIMSAPATVRLFASATRPDGFDLEPKLGAYYEKVDKWVGNKRRKAGLLKRIRQVEEDDTISDTAGVEAPRTKSIRVRA